METIRVFVSSTFRDMQAERDHLMGKVFTRLRAECLRRGADFVPVDLRWGITQQETDSGLSVSICLKEIDRCRPFFLSLLGDRYGWIPTPEKVPLKIFARANTPENRSLLDRWYELDQSSAVPIYQLRPGRQPPDEMRRKLVTLWQGAGLESAGDSVTAIEISHAAFQKTRSQVHAFFYLRDLDETGLADSFKGDFFEQEDECRVRLERLKANVKQARRRRSATVRSYSCAHAGLRVDVNLLRGAARKTIRHIQEDGLIDADELQQLDKRTRAKVEKEGAVALSGMESFGEMVFKDLWKAIAPYLASERAPLDPYLQQRAYHESFLNERTRLFLGRQDPLDRILGYARDQTKREPLVITGNPGSGKSAVMAQAARLLREALPDCLVAPYFIGAAPGSNDLRQTVEYLCQTLRRECSLKEEPVLDPERLQTQLQTFLAKAARKKRVVLLIDALNQMDPAGRSHELNWLPYYLPRNVHMIVSTLPEDTFDVLLQRVPAKDVLNIRELAEKERRILIRERLAWRGKKLTEDQQNELLDRKKRPAAGLPLYLSVALEELSLLGNFDTLSARIDGLPPGLPDLFGQVLDRLKLDHQIASPVLKWLTVARSGLLESEIIDLLKKFLDESRTLHWIQFYSALEAYLRPRGEADSLGRIDFYHDQLRLVSYRDYLKMKTPRSRPTPEYRRTHGQLADYFHSLAHEPSLPARWRTDQRWALRELPYHLTKAGRRSEARKLLLDFDWINAKLEATDVNSVAADYDLVPGDDQLQQVQGAIRLAASVLDDRSQLAAQLLGRLLSAKGRGIRAMLDQAQRWRGAPWLRPLSRTLGGPGEPSARPFVGVSAVGVTPDLRRAIFGSGDGTIKVWDLRRQVELRSLGESSSSRRAVAITPDGRLALSTGKDHALNIWSPLKSAKPIRILKGHTGTVTAIAITPDGRRMVSAAEDQTIRTWDLTRVHQESRVLGYVLPVSALAITPDGGRAVSASGEGVLQVWQTNGTAGGRIIGRHRGLVRALALTPDGHRAIASSDKTLTVWEVEGRRKSRKLIGHKNLVRTVTVTADGKRAISGSDDIRLRVWDLEGESESIEFEAHAWAITALAVTRDGRNIVSCSDDEMLKVWDLDALCQRKAAEPLRMLTGSSGWVNAVAMMPAGDSFISASRDQTIKVWDIRKREVVRTLAGHRGWVNAVAITPDGQRVVSGSDDYSLGVWDLGDKAKVRFLEGHTNGISAVAVTPDGKRAVSGCWDQTFKIWDLENWTIKRSLRGHTVKPKGEAWIRAIAMTPDAKQFISASHDNTLRIWDLESGNEIRRLIGHKNWVMSVAVFPDGRRAISASADKTLRIWDLLSGKEMMRLEGHNNYVTCVALIPGGKHAASTSEDQTLRVWDLQTGKPVACFTADGQLRACAITPDGKLIVAGEDSGRMHFLELL